MLRCRLDLKVHAYVKRIDSGPQVLLVGVGPVYRVKVNVGGVVGTEQLWLRTAHLSLSSAAFSASSSLVRAVARRSWARSNSSSTSWMRLLREATSLSACGREEGERVRGSPEDTGTFWRTHTAAGNISAETDTDTHTHTHTQILSDTQTDRYIQTNRQITRSHMQLYLTTQRKQVNI